MKAIQLYLWILCCVGQSCSHKYYSIDELETNGAKLSKIQPTSIWKSKNTVKFKQRLFLNVRGREFEFVALLMIHPNHDFLAQAYSEGPAPVFTFSSKGDQIDVQVVPDVIGKNIVLQAVVPDIKLAYLLSPTNTQHISAQGETNHRLGFRTNDQQDLVSKVVWDDYSQVAEQRYAKRIHIDNRQFAYQLVIENLEATTCLECNP